MSLTHEPARPKILEKIKIYILSRAKLLCSLCHEIPCIVKWVFIFQFIKFIIVNSKNHLKFNKYFGSNKINFGLWQHDTLNKPIIKECKKGHKQGKYIWSLLAKLQHIHPIKICHAFQQTGSKHFFTNIRTRWPRWKFVRKCMNAYGLHTQNKY